MTCRWIFSSADAAGCSLIRVMRYLFYRRCLVCLLCALLTTLFEQDLQFHDETCSTRAHACEELQMACASLSLLFGCLQLYSPSSSVCAPPAVHRPKRRNVTFVSPYPPPLARPLAVAYQPAPQTAISPAALELIHPMVEPSGRPRRLGTAVSLLLRCANHGEGGPCVW